jgi:hypothetical protein
MNPLHTLSPRMGLGFMAKTVARCRASNAFLAALLVCCAVLFGPPGLRAAADTMSGNLLIEAKGEVEVYHNGRKIVLRDKSDDKQHFRVKLPERAFKAGDTVVLHVRSPYVYRTIAAAINLSGKAGQIPIKKSHWRVLGEGKDAAKITAADIEASQALPALAGPDPTGESEREKLGILPASKGGSDWVKTEQKLNGWYCIGFVLTPEMLKTPLP